MGDRQQRVIAFLSKPESYAPVPDHVSRIDTHAAIVFLAGDRAFKIKRAIKLPYLDFRKLEERYRVCQRELEINQPHAPTIYEDVVPIVAQADDKLQIGGEGSVVEWVLRMRRFDQEDILDAMATQGALDTGMIRELADTLVEFHAHAPVARWHNGVSGLQKVITMTSAAFGRFGPTLEKREVRKYRESAESTFKEQHDYLKARAAEGYVRRCHGDLHLRNIVLLDGKPTLFDAIEFDENIGTIDILYDLAFLLMDLWHRGMEQHANALLNRYIYSSGEAFSPKALRLMPLFLSLRAAVRSMVALDTLSFTDASAHAEKVNEARTYFDLAASCLKPNNPSLIAIGGLSGTGKSTLAAAIAPDIGAVPGAHVVRSDIERKLLFGVAPETRLNKEAYTHEASERVYEQVCQKAAQGLEAGHSIVADAVFARPEERAAIAKVGVDHDVPFVGIWLEADEDVLVSRVTQRIGDASDADASVVRAQLRSGPGPIDWQKIDASGSPDAIAARVRNCLAAQEVLPTCVSDRSNR
ncbi:MAG: AAA family ATPase [Hyphomicrobiaceae bacterium]